METSYAQPNKFLNGFQNIQNAMMSTASKKNISNHKSQFMRKIIPYILTIISFNQ